MESQEDIMEAAINLESLAIDMINRLSKTDAHFKHQQRGEPDLTCQEKSAIASEILKKNPALFLERFSQCLTLNDVECFKQFRGDYRIDFYIDEINKRCADTSKSVVKNRRYQALKFLMDEGEYFSEDEMKWRDPLLYAQMIGQYESESEVTEKMEQEIDKSDLKFSTILLKHMDNLTNKQHFEMLKEMEEEQEEEEEEESEEEEENKSDSKQKSFRHQDINTSNNVDEISSVEKAYLRTEFLRIMQERFLSGDDSNFDYSKVDSNADYDALDIVSYDAEEKYFDADGEDGDQSRDSSLSRQLECIELDRQQADVEEEDYMKFVPSEDVNKIT
ncbi:coiled-coil domain-containing protein 97 [Biomphalaria pfeifferi]|uniref:Coiled-coil domain-containing protein 97 n=1 Tax=Biomphalaria pfeifferi TaxID=112525 RepID=A0AAD8BLS1_BIOPF|nr:coiled-coil domain-containing protein 97 [Biomphalaria pfeifferi]